MRIPFLRSTLPLCAAVSAACSSAPQSATPAPQPGAVQPAAAAAPGAAALVGDWAVQLQVQGRNSSGSMRITPSGGGYIGILQLDTAGQVSSIRSVTVDGTHFVATLSTPDGDASIEGNLRTAALMEATYNGRHVTGRFIANRR
jgi:hypothetical protein